MMSKHLLRAKEDDLLLEMLRMAHSLQAVDTMGGSSNNGNLATVDEYTNPPVTPGRPPLIPSML